MRARDVVQTVFSVVAVILLIRVFIIVATEMPT